MKIYRPIKTNWITQNFGENLACVKLDSNGNAIRPFQIHRRGFVGSCPVGYTKLYPVIGMKSHNGIDLGLWHGEPVYHSGDYVGRMKTHIDNNGGVGVDIVSREPLLRDGIDNLEHHIKLRYWHLKSVVGWDDMEVKPGQLIGYGNDTGISGGDHLHFGLKPCNSYGVSVHSGNGYFGAINPDPYYENKFVVEVIEDVKAEALSAIQQAQRLIYQVKLFIQQWNIRLKKE